MGHLFSRDVDAALPARALQPLVWNEGDFRCKLITLATRAAVLDSSDDGGAAGRSLDAAAAAPAAQVGASAGAALPLHAAGHGAAGPVNGWAPGWQV